MFFSLITAMMLGTPAMPPSISTQQDTIHKVLVSNEFWKKSSIVDFQTCNRYPWSGSYARPTRLSYNSFVNIGQPFGFPSVGVLPDSKVVKSGTGVRFYKTSIYVDTTAVITSCRFRGFVDDDMEIFINGMLVAREQTGVATNHAGAPHDLVFYDYGPYINGYNGGDSFDVVSMQQIGNIFTEGHNEVILAIRNKRNEIGGFSFRMDLKYVVDPNWVNLSETNKKTPFTIYPNPVKDVLYIENLDFSENEKIDVTILSIGGKHIKKLSMNATKNNRISTSDLASGTYLIYISNKKYTHYSKFIKY